MGNNLSEQVINRVLDLYDIAIPAEVLHQAKRCILDYCGVVLAGTEVNKEKNINYLDAVSQNYTDGECTMFGMKSSADIYTAALINAMNAHVIELDDGHRFGMMHMGATIISAVFAVAEKREISGEIQLRAIICGYEVAIALARQIQPGHKLKGYHATGTCCVVGAAMAIGLMLHYTSEQLQGTLSAAATSAAGLLEVIDDGSQLKPYNVGHAAVAAIMSAFTGGAGFQGPEDVLGGKRGFFAVLAKAEDYLKIKESVLFEKDIWFIEQIYTKPYAACRHCHPAIEATLHIRSKLLEAYGKFEESGIKKIDVETYRLAIVGHDKKNVTNVSAAKMSTPYSVAVALLKGLAGIDAYEAEFLAEQDLRELREKVEIKLNEELDALSPQKRAAIVKVFLEDGNVYCERVDYPRGEPENKMTDKELEEKFENLACFNGKEEKKITRLKEIIWNFEVCYKEIFELLA